MKLPVRWPGLFFVKDYTFDLTLFDMTLELYSFVTQKIILFPYKAVQHLKKLYFLNLFSHKLTELFLFCFLKG